MQIESVTLKRFKRFRDLRIELPAGLKLILLAGPNGTGKSSLFDGLSAWHRLNGGAGFNWDETYFPKSGELESGNSPNIHELVNVTFHGGYPQHQSERRRAFSFRSAYRNDPQFRNARLERLAPIEDDVRFSLMIENDAAVERNYQRIASQALEDVFVNEDPRTTIGAFREKAIGDVRAALMRVFPTLVLNDLGNPLTDGTFRFDKGTSSGFLYKNLSGGEKAAFDLLLDFVIKARTFKSTIYCIDEPEAHMNSRVQASLLGELYEFLPNGCQLWLATHSIGMMRRAREIGAQHPGSVTFLDFHDIDFDLPHVMKPVVPGRRFWTAALGIALDDMATLVAPRQVILCEGTPVGGPSVKNTAHDAVCYELIFEEEFSDTRFLSAGNSHDVQSDRLLLLSSIQAIVGTSMLRLIDRDDHSEAEIAEFTARGIRVLSKRHLECFLYHDSVLEALCTKYGKPEMLAALLQDKLEALATVAAQGKPSDDLKSASGMIYTKAKQRLSLTGIGNDAKAFERNVLARLIQPGMAIYEELRASIFETT